MVKKKIPNNRIERHLMVIEVGELQCQKTMYCILDTTKSLIVVVVLDPSSFVRNCPQSAIFAHLH